jgi:hypothetical protein
MDDVPRAASASRGRPPRADQAFPVVRFVAILLIGALAASACTASAPRSSEGRLAVARDLLAGVHVSAAVVSSSLAATSAMADFGVDGGVRLVRVRILDEVRLELRIEAGRDVALAAPPRVCLVGPYAAPDDAGLTDPCWGQPDLGALVAAALATDGSGHPALAAGHPVVVDATLRRGDARCDYPPGGWTLQVAADPMVDASAAGVLDLPALAVAIPFQGITASPLLPIDQTRYCGLATAVYGEQGEPPVPSP